ncbi:MAG: RluA family pseudouridine synthase [Bacteroidia bacterium]|nr:RluA family pseudouridine synthase [Bacteroidia bacterium]
MKSRPGIPPGPPGPDHVLPVTQPDELMRFLLAKLPQKNRNNIKTLLRDKQVLVEGQVVTQFNHPLLPGQTVHIRRTKIPKEKHYQGISIVFEDQHLVVINKHAGILSISTDNERNQAPTAYQLLSQHVKREDPQHKIFVVHRLDRETSGLMMFAKTERVQQLLQTHWHTTVIERTYLAIIEGSLPEPEGTVTSYLRESKAHIVYSSQDPESGQLAITHYQTLRTRNGYSLLKVNLETGRKNQVRVHMQDLQHSLIGDKKYGSKVDPIGRLGLHAWVLAFVHPVTGERLHFETPAPARFNTLV